MRLFILGSYRQSEIEFTVLTGLTLKGNNLFVCFNNGFGYKHTESDTGLILTAATVALVESLKDIRLVVIGNSVTFVVNGNPHLALLHFGKRDAKESALVGKFNGIIGNVIEYLIDRIVVARYEHIIFVANKFDLEAFFIDLLLK